jgi:hypothetical protein
VLFDARLEVNGMRSTFRRSRVKRELLQRDDVKLCAEFSRWCFSE